MIKIGDDTVIGRIAQITTSTTNKDTPIRKEIKNYIKILISLPVIFAIIVVILGAFYYPPVLVISYVVGIFIASVPEGVLVAVSVCLTLSAKRMASKNVLVKTLESVETLGSTSVIFKF